MDINFWKFNYKASNKIGLMEYIFRFMTTFMYNALYMYLTVMKYINELIGLFNFVCNFFEV